ncbi:Periplasmic protein involved in polysaccharide export precursor [Sphingobium chlorophenolicum]|uniref:Periplasmic protein involved in polysaccharide export n=1 Tax=Sphingobium chlorophenolicum TaxID=46429 RepID=A0A081RGP4_SPHCR|nr:polysaccharide biosynthesis/export family protein [Sphingobium chlorophenolicum]KEQ54367.1 Periplasmic protein involved in polysaccharide export precursor [Sphingobium chlorophenolicum]
MRNPALFRIVPSLGLTLALLPLVSGCNSTGLTTSVGPSRSNVDSAVRKQSIDGVQIIDLDPAGVAAMPKDKEAEGLARTIGDAVPFNAIVGPGDGISISVVEAPPAVLFGAGTFGEGQESIEQVSNGSMPEIMVNPAGQIAVPFAGQIQAAGRTPEEIARDVELRLRKKAHLPQVSVRIVRNASANVVIGGEVNNSTRLPLSPKGERLLDAISAAGGVKPAANKTTIQVARGSKIASMPLDLIFKHPTDNIILQAGDVVTAIYQPYSFTVLGAASRSGEVEFEATGLTLAQALGRVGGLQDQRANPKGVFLFRWEDSGEQGSPKKIPVIYRINMKDPAMYFVMQKFQMQDKDVLYVANSSLAEFQRFAGIIASTLLPAVAVSNAVR